MNKYACWLNNIPGIGRRTILTLLESGTIHSAEELYELSETTLAKLCGEVFQGKAQTVIVERILRAHMTAPEQIMEKLQEKNIQFVSLEDSVFPRRLREIPDKPYAIYFKGRLPVEQRPSVAIVGTRDCSIYGQEEASYFAKNLAKRGIQIVSGMARGIDGIAGMAAAKAVVERSINIGEKMSDEAVAVPSYAVLGCGVDICYPKQNRVLYEILCERGGVLSESVPGTEPKAGLFPQRNRIISGLADYILVIEARKRSGTFITVDQALEQGKTVYALPGRVSDPLSVGCNTLLRQGAVIATDPEDIVEDIYGFSPSGKKDNTSVKGSLTMEEEMFEQRLGGLSNLQRDIVRVLHKIDAMTVEQIVEKLESSSSGGIDKVNTSEVLIALVQLQICGLAKELGVGYYTRG